MVRYHSKLIVAGLIGLSVSHAVGQERTLAATRRVWMEAGTGLLGSNDHLGAPMFTAVHVQVGKVGLAGRFLRSNRFAAFPIRWGIPDGVVCVQEFSLVVSKCVDYSWGVASIGAGIANTSGATDGDPSTGRFSGTGVIVDLQSTVVLFSSAGLSAHLFANVYRPHPYVGMLISLSFGSF